MNHLSLAALRRDYLSGERTPREVLAEIHQRLPRFAAHNAYIHVLTPAQVEPCLAALKRRDPAELPLYGVPFAIKDNIDLAGVPTTAACPAHAYTPQRSATVVQRLIDAGAVPVGKTNLDQFATGLVGTRSPYGIVRNALHPDYIAGGSSSGSAVAVALGLASFALGTDTAGSGRVPAAFNGIVGLKPSPGLLSTLGVVPACRSLDCVSVFALNPADAAAVLAVAEGYDAEDPYSRPPVPCADAPPYFRFGVPRPAQLEFCGDVEAARAYAVAVEHMEEAGGCPLEIDFAPFAEAARLLYEGPWLAERYLALRAVLEHDPHAVLPVLHELLHVAPRLSAMDAYTAQHRLQHLKREADRVLAPVELILTPTAPTVPRIADEQADPIGCSRRLGYYTNFMNLLGYAAVAVPAGHTDQGLPFGVTLYAEAGSDRRLLRHAERFLATYRQRLELAVCGAHLRGQPLSGQLRGLGGQFLTATTTAPGYRLYALPGGPPRRPGLVRESGGRAIEVEVWSLPTEQVGALLAGIPAPLGLGRVELADGRWVHGFLCESHALHEAHDISAHGGWRSYLLATRGEAEGVC